MTDQENALRVLESCGVLLVAPLGAADILAAEFAAVRAPLERRVAQLEAEAGHHDHWHAFGARVWRWLAENWDTEDGWELAEIAALSGLAEHVKYDPDIHGECEAEPGDDIIYPLRGDPAFAALAGAPEREDHDDSPSAL